MLLKVFLEVGDFAASKYVNNALVTYFEAAKYGAHEATIFFV